MSTIPAGSPEEGSGAHEGVAAEARRRSRQLTALAELGQVALTRIGLEIILGQTAALVESVLGSSRCSIVQWLTDEEWSRRSAVGAILRFDACPENSVEHGPLLAAAVASEGPVLITHEAIGSEVLEHLGSRHGVVSGIAVPVRQRGSAYGVLLVFESRERSYFADELEFVQAVADLTGGVVERARVERALADSEYRFRSLIENSSDGIVLIDRDAKIEYASPSTTRLIGYREKDLRGLRIDSLVHPEDQNRARRNHRYLMSAPGETLRDELRVRHAGGYWLYVEAVAQNLVAEPGLRAIVINYRDVSERRAAERQLERLAYRDSLTDLPNRFLFRDRLEQTLEHARRERMGVAIIYLDLDHFKLVNDTLGHAVGDQLLKSIAARLKSVTRAEDTIARLGGDEFAMLLPGVDQAEAAGGVASKLIESLRRPFLVGEHQLYAQASAGISMFPGDGEDVETLLKSADSALYRAKETGRNNVQLFTQSMNQRYRSRLEMEQRLRVALDRDELSLFYQPIVDRASRSVRRVEALLRWRLPNGTMVPPDEFIPVAEETGVILSIGDWVLDRACGDLASWHAEGLTQLGVSVNLSAHQLQRPTFVGSVTRAVEAAGIRPGDLELEITESAALQNLQWTLGVLDQLNSYGVTIAVDDFGTGQSSLAYLKRFPLHTLKIDREFLRDVSNSSDEALLSSIILLGHSLELYVVAEGIETADEFSLLERHGCDGMQGYLLGRPAPAAEIPGLVRNLSWPSSAAEGAESD